LLKSVTYECLREGVYDCQRGTDRIRIIVAGELALEEQNAMIHLFSAAEERIQYGRDHVVQISESTSTTVDKILGKYRSGGMNMPYTLENLAEDCLEYLPVKKRLVGLKPKEVVSSFGANKILASIPPDEIASYLKKVTAQKGTSKRKLKRKKA
jgi:hypothetical protein